ncbi:sugar transporter ERD6-like 16 isoform X1 [Apium graveolens]|uniref:sugar transporter ERD6-like 16 isoform X1 n=2 Tax=Apium graveolens TaxID=4045 RepID=UPI003D7AA3A0
MAIEHVKDIENGGDQDLEQPFLEFKEVNSGSIGVVLYSTFVSVCGSFEFGSCVGYSAPTQSGIREDLDLTLAQYSMFGSSVTIGAMIAAFTSGKIADFVGRKGAMRMSAAFCIAGWLAVYLSMGALSLDIGRFLTGYGIGIVSYVVPVYIAEIAPSNLRGGLTTLNQLMICIGSSLAFVMGTIITWRNLALTGLVPCFVMLVGLFFIPESPRWLAKVGLEKEFEVSLRRLRGQNADIAFEAAEIQANVQSLRKLSKAKLTDLVEAKYIRSVIIAVGLMIFQQFGGINGISFYASQTFVAAGITGNIGTLAYAVIQVPITMVGAILMDKSGRRPLLLVSATGTFLGCFLTGTAFLLEGQKLLLQWIPTLAVSGVLTYIASFSIGMGAVPWVIMSEIFPLHIKGLAGSLAVLINWLGAWAVSYTFNFLMSWSCPGTFFVFSGFCALTVLFVAKVVPETKGKTLEEIQASINS